HDARIYTDAARRVERGALQRLGVSRRSAVKRSEAAWGLVNHKPRPPEGRPGVRMTTKEQDTDPSTPGAMRGLAPTDPMPAPVAASLHVSTDPGVGPPSQPPMASAVPVHKT